MSRDGTKEWLGNIRAFIEDLEVYIYLMKISYGIDFIRRRDLFQWARAAI